MTINRSTEQVHSLSARQVAGAIALAAFMALAAQPLLGEGSYGENLSLMLRWFTIWGNIGACVIMALIAVGKRIGPGIMAALATALTIIASIYWVLLSGDHHPTGYDRITNQFHHTIIPAAGVLWWLAFTPKAPSTLALVPIVMIPPICYGIFTLINGHLTGFYAYFFLDLPTLGWPQFALSNAMLAVFFAVAGAILVTLKNALGR